MPERTPLSSPPQWLRSSIALFAAGWLGGCTPKIPEPPPPAQMAQVPAARPSETGTVGSADAATGGHEKALSRATARPVTPEDANAPVEAVDVHQSAVLASEALAANAAFEGGSTKLEVLLLASGGPTIRDEDDVNAVEDPEGHEQWRGATLAVRREGAGEASPWMELNLDAFADHYSLHLAWVRESPPLLDVRVNTHNGEDNWSTGVDAYLLRVEGIDRTPRTIWEGSESYEGVLDICTTMDSVSYESKERTVELVRSAQRIYSPSEPGDRERVPRSECPPQAKKETGRRTVWPLSPDPRADREDPAARER